MQQQQQQQQRPLKIAFGSNYGVGKDDACNHLIAVHGGTNVKFASHVHSISQLAYDAIGMPYVKDRELLQAIGTWGRRIDPRLWVNLCEKQINATTGNIFVSDLRFENEMIMLRNNGFKCYKIVRDYTNVSHRTHESENALNSVSVVVNANHPQLFWDGVIYNNGTVEEFHKSLSAIISQ